MCQRLLVGSVLTPTRSNDTTRLTAEDGDSRDFVEI